MNDKMSRPNIFVQLFSKWMMKELAPSRPYLCDFNYLSGEVRPGDVLLIEGHSRASRIIKEVTQSAWSHAALYLGNYESIYPKLSEVEKIKQSHLSPRTQCLIESEVGFGTILTPISKYQNKHIRIARPSGLNKGDIDKIIDYTLGRLGTHYHIRHLLDLARFLFPWTLFPRRWRSVLFEHNAKQPTHDICSSLIAHAFQAVHYPILPYIEETGKETLRFTKRNPKLFTPSDFDYSPYFDVIKYPIISLKAYKKILWEKDKCCYE